MLVSGHHVCKTDEINLIANDQLRAFSANFLLAMTPEWPQSVPLSETPLMIKWCSPFGIKRFNLIVLPSLFIVDFES